MPTLALIAAVAKNRVIGKDNGLLWHLPEDMRHFRETTRGKPVIMGRKTWESLPDAFRPLPGRQNIVISRNPAYAAAGASLAHSLGAALELAGDAAEVCLIGGAELYRQAIASADLLYLTEIDRDYDGDVIFPEVSGEEWEEVSRRAGSESSAPAYDFVVYRRRKA